MHEIATARNTTHGLDSCAESLTLDRIDSDRNYEASQRPVG